ncbi:fused signal recognition particle receptor [Methanobrevibacter olleyae]|uniref:Signal recognition particle receptor FtsY n=1 Tax=Methanobrevibacter olleyae TaxID=294671 RepID=A0A1I4G922_METOL|nr:signal recognition particle-docking protein FtsY [Methanobrevibacter olleyae]SFL26484.1 fused signal recognition particle receptor [Methanobrevibacter olleyae]
MFDSLKKKFAETSGKLRNKVEDEAKEENNVESIEESSEYAFDEAEELEDIEELFEEKIPKEESFDDDSKEISEEKSNFFSFLKRDKKEGSEEELSEGIEEASELESLSKELSAEDLIEESEKDEGEVYEGSSEDSGNEEVYEDSIEDSGEKVDKGSKKSRRSLFRRSKKEQSGDGDRKGKSSGFLSFIKEKSISEDDVEDILFELELGLLEADVAMDVSSVVVESVKNDLVGQKIKRSSDIEEYIYEALKKAVSNIIDIEGKSMTELLEEKVSQGEPLIVMLVGINGTGKTTTIGKLSNYYIKKGYTPVIAASDTFRAGAIEQIAYHADKLGVKLIKHEKGSDPAAIAFDAVQHAKAKGKELVLIDTAGRMQTNTNLMDEMKKIRRVSKPDLVVFVGDALTGNDATEQARKFNEAIDIDGVILTKADADSKGGAALSVGYIIKKPILFLGMGQSFDDIKEYDADWMLEQIFS